MLRFSLWWAITLSNRTFATASLEVSGTSVVLPSTPRITTAFVSWSNPAPGALTSFTTSRSTPLRAELAPSPLERVVRLGREADQDLVRAAAGGQAGQDVGRRFEHQLGDPVLLGQLRSRRPLRSEVGHRRGHDHDVRAFGRRAHGVLHLGRRLDVDPCHRGGHVGRKREWRGGHERDRRAAPGCRDRDGVPLLARRAVGDEAHRVEGFTRTPGTRRRPAHRAGRAGWTARGVRGHVRR